MYIPISNYSVRFVRTLAYFRLSTRDTIRRHENRNKVHSQRGFYTYFSDYTYTQPRDDRYNTSWIHLIFYLEKLSRSTFGIRGSGTLKKMAAGNWILGPLSSGYVVTMVEILSKGNSLAGFFEISN